MASRTYTVGSPHFPGIAVVVEADCESVALAKATICLRMTAVPALNKDTTSDSLARELSQEGLTVLTRK